MVLPLIFTPRYHQSWYPPIDPLCKESPLLCLLWGTLWCGLDHHHHMYMLQAPQPASLPATLPQQGSSDPAASLPATLSQLRNWDTEAPLPASLSPPRYLDPAATMSEPLTPLISSGLELLLWGSHSPDHHGRGLVSPPCRSHVHALVWVGAHAAARPGMPSPRTRLQRLPGCPVLSQLRWTLCRSASLHVPTKWCPLLGTPMKDTTQRHLSRTLKKLGRHPHTLISVKEGPFEPTTYSQAHNSQEACQWKMAIVEELNLHTINSTSIPHGPSQLFFLIKSPSCVDGFLKSS